MENLVLKRVNGTLVPCVGVRLLDSPRRDSQSDGKQPTADWLCRVALPGCHPRFALRPGKRYCSPTVGWNPQICKLTPTCCVLSIAR